VYTHNGLHHGWTNLKGKDVVFAPFSFEEYQALAWQRRLLERLYRTPWGLGLMHLTQVWWKYELFPAPYHARNIKGTFFFDRLLVLGFLLTKIGMGVWLSFLVSSDLSYSIIRALSLLLVTYAVWFWLIGFVTFQQHTHPDVPWYDKLEEWDFFRGQIHGTPHISFPRWFHKLLHNVMDHNAHHVDPLIPMYQLPASQRRLERAYSEDLVSTRWSLRGYFHSCKVCRLYDYDNHQWLNFDGTPSSRSRLNQLSMTPPTKVAA
jgi:omega-6 fatty acid desaturase (delta-12 desaturase)